MYDQEIMIKIEPNLVLRGSVFECELRGLCQRTRAILAIYPRTVTRTFGAIDAIIMWRS